MSMLGVQSVVARLCLVREFRRAWAADPAAAMRALPLTDDERKMVRGLDVGVVAAFGNNLIQKRIGMMREWFPHTFTAMDHELSRHVTTCHLERYTQTHVREGDEYAGRWMRRESERLASYLLEIVTHDVVPLPALKDVIRFERERLRVMIDPDSARSMLKSADDRVWNVGVTRATEVVRPRHVTLLETDYDVPLLTELIRRGTSLRTAGAKRSWILYIRRGPTSVETFAVSEASSAIMKIADTTTTVREIVDQLRQRYSAHLHDDDLGAACERELVRLVALGALVPTPESAGVRPC